MYLLNNDIDYIRFTYGSDSIYDGKIISVIQLLRGTAKKCNVYFCKHICTFIEYYRPTTIRDKIKSFAKSRLWQYPFKI